MTLGDKLIKLRKAKDLSQEQVAEKAGISRRAYQTYEKDEKKPRTETIYENLAKVLGCRTQYLIADTKAYSDGFEAALKELTEVLPLTMPGTWTAEATDFLEQFTKNAKRLFENEMSTGWEEVPELSSPKGSDSKDTYSAQLHFSITATGLVMSALAKLRIPYTIVKSPDNKDLPEFTLELENESIKKWSFTLMQHMKLKFDEPQFIAQQARSLICSYSLTNADPETKYSIIVEDKKMFEELCRLKGHNCLRCNLSAILVDIDSNKIISEEMLAWYSHENLNIPFIGERRKGVDAQ